jgi:ribokinase
MGNIIIVGSINMDFVYYVRKHPLPGETVQSYKTELKSGGKGANQAVAAALSGGQVTLVGAVGNDPFSQEIMTGLQGYQVNTNHILRKESSIGTAFITVDELGQNSIVLSEGANGCLSVEDLQLLPELFGDSSILLIQNEIPWNCTQFVIEAANRKGIPTYFNPAPALVIPEAIFPLIDVMILNETETEIITSMPLSPDLSDVKEAAYHIIQLGVKEVIITLGDKGSFYMNKQEEVIYTSAYPVKVVDTTAAGDTFIGSFIVARQQGLSVRECLLKASAASAIVVSREGAQESIPHADEVSEFMEKNKAST